MTFVEFLNFFAMFIIAEIVLRAMQIFGRDTWLAPALGAIHS